MVLQRRKNLAMIFQAVFTHIVRLRSRRLEVADEASFRRDMRRLIAAAEGEAISQGCRSEDVNEAKFALVVFLDNAVLDGQPNAFVQWRGFLLQQEWFGINNGGQVFYEKLKGFLRRDNSVELADLLEVYYLCLLLGFRGQFPTADTGETRERIIESTAARITRIRSTSVDLTPTWQIPPDPPPSPRPDPWVRKLFFAMVVCVALALVLFMVFRHSLHSRISQIGGALSLVNR